MTDNNKRVLVTGATGFTGGALAKKLIEQSNQEKVQNSALKFTPT